MGLFRKVGNVLFGSGKAPQYDPSGRLAGIDLSWMKNLRDKEITSPRKSTELQLEQLEKDKAQAVDDAARQRSGLFASLAGQQAMSGGLTGGSTERAARQAAQQAGLQNIDLLNQFANQKSGLVASDYAAQEDLRNQAGFGMPNIQSGIAQQYINSDLANIQAAQLAKASRQSRMYSLLGAAAGAGLGYGLGGTGMATGIGAMSGSQAMR